MQQATFLFTLVMATGTTLSAAVMPSRFRVAPSLEAGAAWHSNIFLRDSAFGALLPVASDRVVSLRPRLDFTAGDEDTRLHLQAQVGMDFLRFDRFADYDQEAPFLSASLRGRTATLESNLRLRWENTALPSPDERPEDGLVRRTSRSLRADTLYAATDVSQVFASFDWDERRFDDAAAARLYDWRTIATALEWRLHWSERLFLGPGVRWRSRHYGNDETLNDATAQIYLSWEATPFVTIAGRIGTGRSDRNDAGSSYSFASSQLDARMALRETVQLTAAFNSDLRTEASGSLRRDRIVSLAATWTPRESMSTRVSAMRSSIREYVFARRDQLTRLELSQAVALTTHFSATVTLGHTRNASNSPGYNYRDTSVSFSTRLRW